MTTRIFMGSEFQGIRDPLDPNNLPTVFPDDPYDGQVFYDWKSKKIYEYTECYEGSTDENGYPVSGLWTATDEDGLPVKGFWSEIDWDF